MASWSRAAGSGGVYPPERWKPRSAKNRCRWTKTGGSLPAFDRDANPAATLRATLADGRTVTSPLAIAPRAWDIERVNVARRAGGSSASFMRRRQPELDAIWDARLRETGATGWRQDFIWPVKGRISGRFGAQRIYRGEPGSYHSGIDLSLIHI